MVAELLVEIPNLTVTFVRDVTPYKDVETLERFVVYLETAGLPP